MLFQSGGIKAGDGESWIPLCLPAFNSSGYLYMYVSFFEPDSTEATGSAAPPSPEEATAIILISADRESFFELQGMRDKVGKSQQVQSVTLLWMMQESEYLVTKTFPSPIRPH